MLSIKVRQRWFLVCAAAALITACGAPETPKQEPAEPNQKVTYSDEQHERHTLIKLLWTEQYAELDKALAEAYAEKDKGAITSNRLRGRFWQLQNVPPEYYPKFNAWVAQQQSIYAYLARGFFLIEQGSQVRGDGLARDVPDNVMEKAKELSQKGVDDMNVGLKMDARCAMCVGGKIWANYVLNGRDPELINQALELDPTLWQPVGAHFGLLYPQWGGSEEEMQAFIKKMEAVPGTEKSVQHLRALVYYNRGQLHQSRTKDYDAAIRNYENAIALYPDSDALKNAAELYLRKGNADKAISYLELNLKENDPWDLYTLEALAQAYFAKGDDANGQRLIKKRDELITRFRNGE